MKKYLLVSLAMLFAAAFVWADEAKEAEGLKMDVSGDATLEWGIDRGSGKDAKAIHGFNNKAKIEVKIPLVKKGDKVSKGDAPVYAEVKVGEIEATVKAEAKDDGPGKSAEGSFGFDGTVKKVSAKLHFYGAYLSVYDKPSFKTNYAKMWEPVNKHGDHKDNFKYEPGFDGFGTKLGYAKKDLMDLDVGVKFGSITNMDGKDPDNNNRPHVNYGAGFDFSMKPVKDLFEFALGVNATFDEAQYYFGTDKAHKNGKEKAIGFGAEVVSKPVKDLELKLGFDGGTATTDKAGKSVSFAWDMMFNAKYKWVSGGVYVASIGTPFEGATKDNKPTADLGLYAKFETKGEKPEDANFLLKGLDAGAYLGVYHLLSSSNDKDVLYPMLMKVYASYQQPLADGMWIKPYGEVWGESNHKLHKDGTLPADWKYYFGVMYKLGVAFQPVEKVEIDAFWQHGKQNDIKNNNVGGMNLDHVLTPAQKNNHNGMFKLAVKVKF